MGAISRVYNAGALSYDDDIPLLCPSVWGLTEILKPYNKYSAIIEGESAYFNGVMLEWTDKVRR